MRRSLPIFLPLVLLAMVPSSAHALANDPPFRTPPTGCTWLHSPSQAPKAEYETDPDNVELVGRVIVSPTSIEGEWALEPGESFTCTITLRNRHERRVALELQPVGLRGSRSGLASAEFIDPDDEDSEATAARWITPMPAKVTLDPRGVVKVPVRVTVPEDPPVGPAYASLHVISKSTAAGPGETNIGIESVVSIPFLLSVGGEGAPELKLREVRAPNLRWSRDPWTLRANLDNDGTLHATPRGRVRVRSLFGNTVHELPIAGTPLLPGGRQRVETTWEDVPWFGFYRYDVRVAPAGDEHADQVTRASGWFLALPPWWVLALAAAILVFAITGGIVRRRRERQWGDDPDDASDESVD